MPWSRIGSPIDLGQNLSFLKPPVCFLPCFIPILMVCKKLNFVEQVATTSLMDSWKWATCGQSEPKYFLREKSNNDSWNCHSNGSHLRFPIYSRGLEISWNYKCSSDDTDKFQKRKCLLWRVDWRVLYLLKSLNSPNPTFHRLYF